MSKIKSIVASVALAGAVALPFSSAQAWWGGPFGGNGFGDGAMSFSMSSRVHGSGYGYPYYGYAPYAYAPYGYAPYGYGYAPYGNAPVAPTAQTSEAK